jgi:hypothetical protein
MNGKAEILKIVCKENLSLLRRANIAPAQAERLTFASCSARLRELNSSQNQTAHLAESS